MCFYNFSIYIKEATEEGGTNWTSCIRMTCNLGNTNNSIQLKAQFSTTTCMRVKIIFF